jgi:hypothetical protein
VKNESQIALPKNFKSKTPVVDSITEADSYKRGNIEKKYNSFGV